MPRTQRKPPDARNYCKGDRHPAAKLTDAEVDVIHELHEAGTPYSALAAKFEVSKSCIAGILQGRRR